MNISKFLYEQDQKQESFKIKNFKIELEAGSASLIVVGFASVGEYTIDDWTIEYIEKDIGLGPVISHNGLSSEWDEQFEKQLEYFFNIA